LPAPIDDASFGAGDPGCFEHPRDFTHRKRAVLLAFRIVRKLSESFGTSPNDGEAFEASAGAFELFSCMKMIED